MFIFSEKRVTKLSTNINYNFNCLFECIITMRHCMNCMCVACCYLNQTLNINYKNLINIINWTSTWNQSLPILLILRIYLPQSQEYDLETMLQPRPLSELVRVARNVSENISVYLPRNSRTDQVKSYSFTWYYYLIYV